METVSIEECLKRIPNKFELSVIVMNRARSILLGSKSSFDNTKYAKKSVNQSLIEIENQELDLDSFKKELRQNLLVNNLFLKNTHSSIDTNTSDSNNIIDLSLEGDNAISDSEDIDDDEDGFIDSDFGVE